MQIETEDKENCDPLMKFAMRNRMTQELACKFKIKIQILKN